MFGEYDIYSDGIIFGRVCGKRLFIKPIKEGREFIGEPTEAALYPGAKPNFLIDKKTEGKEGLSQLIRATVKELAEPKPKKKKK